MVGLRISLAVTTASLGLAGGIFSLCGVSSANESSVPHTSDSGAYPATFGTGGRGSDAAPGADLQRLADADYDGIEDSVDSCLATAADVAVDESGCSVVQLAPCSGPAEGQVWPNHEAFVASVTVVANSFADAGHLSVRGRHRVVAEAAASVCGRPVRVGCGRNRPCPS